MPRLFALPFFAVVLGLAAVATSAAERQPNFVIILADDMGYADLSCSGGDRYQTPNIDALAKRGLRFRDFHSNGAVCSPTRAALLTGRYQQRSGVDEVVFADPARGKRDDHGLKPTEITFARLLKGNGYRTGIMGKWHLGYAEKFNPVHHGFDEFRGYVSGNVDYHSHIDQADFADWWHNLERRDEPGYSTHLITKHALGFLEENKSRPFCLYVANEAPHSPYQGPKDGPVRGPNAGKPVQGAEIQRAYREMVQEMDRGVGEIVATLQRLGLAENTLVFFFSDNGGTREGNNGPLHGFKGSVWEGGHRVPAIAMWPAKIKPGVTDQTAIGMDLLPTLLQLSGTKSPAGHRLDGTSLVPLLFDGKSLPERTLFWGYNDRYAVRRGPWKLVVNPVAEGAKAKKKAAALADPALGLFNLADDLGENKNVAAQNSERVREMQAALAAWKKDVGAGTSR
ncbi:MAG: sulfatase-like hydrolase/transferase [Opitutaceae bacterium]|nr:sulfatase-like hydrolase/transferase [Opitutaceae bacterium]